MLARETPHVMQTPLVRPYPRHCLVGCCRCAPRQLWRGPFAWQAKWTVGRSSKGGRGKDGRPESARDGGTRRTGERKRRQSSGRRKRVPETLLKPRFWALADSGRREEGGDLFEEVRGSKGGPPASCRRIRDSHLGLAQKVKKVNQLPGRQRDQTWGRCTADWRCCLRGC